MYDETNIDSLDAATRISSVEATSRASSNMEAGKTRRLSEEESKNCWLAIKHNKIYFSSITKSAVLLELDYENIVKVETYASAVTLELKNFQISKVKLKTTSSYYIR